MAKPCIVESITKKYSEPTVFGHPVIDIKNNIVKGLVKPSVKFYGSSKAIDERDMRYWKEFEYYPGILIGVMRRWENGSR